MSVNPIVMLCVGKFRCRSEPRCLANPLFVAWPQTPRPHERLVIEASRDEPPECTAHRHEIEPDARPAVDASRYQAIVELHFGGACVGHRECTAFQLHERIGLLDTKSEHASRTVVFPASPNDVDAVGEQGGSKGIADASLVTTTVEDKCHGRLGTVPTCVRTPCNAHSYSPGARSFTLYTAVMRYVTVSRSTLNQRRHP